MSDRPCLPGLPCRHAVDRDRLVARVEELERELVQAEQDREEDADRIGSYMDETAKLRSLLREACGIADVYVDGYEHTKPARRDAKKLARIRAEGGIADE